ncbi:MULTISPECIES: enediyne biosynthesis protein [unclassified Streptomyces]|uniref:enediyne biosynthesis protein n=1 Tax=unclassified Streptomyces TaxID=2593676 RepID=UPI001F0F55D2|nr:MULTISPECIES: enediyne biosynthesis protein [unclassified Streptomyces]
MTAITVSHAKPGPEAKRDPRYLALRNFAISISVFNVLGYTLLGFEQPWLWPIIAALAAYVTEIALELVSAWAQRRPARFLGNGARGVYEFLLPSHITAMAVNMLLYANNQILPVLFGVFAGVAGKHVLQAPIAGRMRHYMNPSNFGITLALVCFGSWVSIAPPYEFTENADRFFRVAIPLIIVMAGTVINSMLTKKIPLIVGWVGGFVIQAVIRHEVWDVALASALAPMSGVAFVLFTNYMISDPGTTPVKPRDQFVFGASVAGAYGVLMLFNVVYTLFFAVTVVCAVRGIGWWVAHLVQKRRASEAHRRDETEGRPVALGESTSEAVAA